MSIFGFLAIAVIFGFGFWIFRSIWAGKGLWSSSENDSLGRSLGKTFLFIGIALGATAIACLFMWLGG